MPTEPTTPRVRKPRSPARRSGLADWFRHLTNKGKAVVGILGAVGAVIVTGLTVDDRYARAGDVAAIRNSQERYALEQAIAIQNLRRAQVADKIYDLQARGNRVQPHERQALSRFQLEYNELSKDIEQKQRLADRMRFGK